MKIPNTVKIGGLDYKVHLTLPTDVGVEHEGRINYREQSISIVYTGKEYAQISFWHEVVHGMLEATGHIKHKEIIVDGLAHQLYQLIKDNPDMFKDDTDDKA